MYSIYILECMDGSLYTGITTDVARRLQEHIAGTASRYTRARKAKRMVYTETVMNRSAALKREAAIKKMPLEKKRSLFESY